MNDRVEEFADRLADLVADRLADRRLAAPAPAVPEAAASPIDAAETARRLGVTREWVYAHASELGVIRLGDGPKARLRFDPKVVAEYRNGESNPPEDGEPTRAAPRRMRSDVELLPIRGESR